MTSTLELQSAAIPALTKNVELSVVLPAFNEADHIVKVIQRLVESISGVAKSFEIVIVDDGSFDGTADKVKSLSILNSSIVLVRNARNMGKGAAVKHAAGFVRGEVVVLLDADMDIDPAVLASYMEALKKYDLCIASKRHPKSDYNAPVARKFLSLGFNMLTRLMTGVTVADSQAGLKAMKRTHFQRIMDMVAVKRYAYDVEMLAVAQLLNLKVAELPIRIEQNSRFDTRAIVYMMIDLLGIAYRLRIIKWYQKNLEYTKPSYKPMIPI